jgi:hypothetical protein
LAAVHPGQLYPFVVSRLNPLSETHPIQAEHTFGLTQAYIAAEAGEVRPHTREKPEGSAARQPYERSITPRAANALA